jgi:3-keto-5-aminohexanoate cleavage enzyme
MTDFSLMAAAVGMGATVVRVGYEDSRHYAPGKVAPTNVTLVEKLVSLIQQIGCEVAEPEEAREILGLD